MIQKMFPHHKITHTLSLCQDVVSVVKRLQHNVPTGYTDWEFSLIFFIVSFGILNRLLMVKMLCL